jgi:hypothetical protein
LPEQAVSTAETANPSFPGWTPSGLPARGAIDVVKVLGQPEEEEEREGPNAAPEEMASRAIRTNCPGSPEAIEKRLPRFRS